MFAADYPFESTDEAAHFIDGVKLDEKVRDDICFNNAARRAWTANRSNGTASQPWSVVSGAPIRHLQ